MKRIKLIKRTIDGIRNPKEGRITYQDAEDTYLHLVLTPTSRSWRYIRKVRGRVVFITLGYYPDTTPDQARRESAKTSAKYTTGGDPQVEKRQARNVTTWGDLFGWYLEAHSKHYKKTWTVDVQVERRYCLSWKSRNWQTITPEVVSRWHKTIGSNHGKIAADRAYALVRSVFNKAIDMNVITGVNPTRGTKMFYNSPQKYARERFLSTEELARLFKALEEYHDRDMSDFFRLCLLTGARRGNVQSMRWEDFDRERCLWRIPGLVSKNGEPMSVPLLPEALAILNDRFEKRRSDEWVFPNRRKNPKTPHMAEPRFAWIRICDMAGIKGVRIHDLRRTLGSWMAMNGTSLAIIGRSLGHKSLQATEIYARLSDEPVRASMNAAVQKMLEAVNTTNAKGTK